MRILYSFLTVLFSLVGYSQTILNQSETGSRTVQDPNVVVLAQGFHATSSVSNPFVAKIGTSTDTPNNPTNSDAGSTNPSGPTGDTTLKFHDTQGNIDVNGGGQLQYTLPIALPPGVKSVAPQINLVYTSGSGNGIAGYGWNISGITAISRTGKTIEKDGELEGVKIKYSDYYSFNGQRLILKSGEYGKDGAEYVTENFSNVKIKSIGAATGAVSGGPAYWEVTFDNGSQAWYGATSTNINSEAITPLEYNIVKWIDVNGNYITYEYTQNHYYNLNNSNNVALISAIKWGGNAFLNKNHFNEILFFYNQRDFVEHSYVSGYEFVQGDKLTKILVNTNIDSTPQPFKEYEIKYKKQNTNYDFVDYITEKNSVGQSANPVIFSYTQNIQTNPEVISIPNNPFEGIKFTGDFNGDSYLDFVMNDGSVKLGAFNDNFTTVSTNKYFGSNSLVVNSLVDTDGHLYNGNGIVQLESNNLVGYILKDNTFQKIFEKKVFENTCSNYSAPNKCFLNSKIHEGDINGDGISDIFITASADVTIFYPCPEINNKSADNLSVPPDYCSDTYEIKIGNFIVDLKNSNNPIATYTDDTGVNDDIYRNQKYVDVNGDGKVDIVDVSNNKWTILEFVKIASNQFLRKIRVASNLIDTKENEFPVLFGDYNGDGKLDFAIPVANQSSDWRFYMGTGYGFNNFLKSNFLYYRNLVTTYTNGNKKNWFQYFYSVSDLNRDGKSDISAVYSFSAIDPLHNYYRAYGFKVFTRIVNNISSYGVLNFDNSQDYSSPTKWIYDYTNLNIFQPITNTIRANNNYYSVFLFRENELYKISAPTSIVELARIRSINQGNIVTIIDYQELIPENSGFYQNYTKVSYPYTSFDRMDQTFAVSKIYSGSFGEKMQSFKYRSFTINMEGKGVIGFRQSARSSFYANGFENTAVWSGAEIDPLNDGVPIKEWSVKTFNNNSIIFPADISENNSQLLSYKKTDYQTDILAYGVKATVPWKFKTKDFLKDITEDSDITYDSHYLPIQTNVSVNGGFATRQTVLSYSHNPSGTGKDYYIGRPLSKTEISTAYNDTKGTVESYSYEDNLLSDISKEPYISDGLSIVERLNEQYEYDGWGNITKKTISYDNARRPNPSLNQSESAQYDDKGRFVIKKTDNLGLETYIEYNDWGQVRKQTDPFGVILENSYDGWGKLLSSKENLSGTTTYQYYRDFGSGNVIGGYEPAKTIVTKYSPDGNITQTYSDKLGQIYKTSSKGFSQNVFVSKSLIYDALGRKIGESEPYFGSVPPSYPNDITYDNDIKVPGWNIIKYNDNTFPPNIKTITSSDKRLEVSVNGNVNVTSELNGYNRITSKTTDALGNVIASTDKGGTINFGYNAAGQQVKAQYDTNAVTTKYDIWGRKAEFTDPSNGTYKYTYDGLGRITKETSPKGYKKYVYNNLGQLATQQELSNDGKSTIKNLTYTYDSKGLLTSRSGTSNGKAYNSTIAYDSYGRVLSTSENSNGRYFMKKGITYDDKMRVTSYEKSLYSSGQYTKVVIENVYDGWSGELYQVKDKTQNKVIWELRSLNAKGQLEAAYLGKTEVSNEYDSNGFLDYVQHDSQSTQAVVLSLDYDFNAIKNELTSRKRGGSLSISESFEYDDNNRLKNWTDPVTGAFTQNATKNTYDVKGRITNNDQVGEIKFANTNKVYQSTGMVLNDNGKQTFSNNLLQQISYNENNDPIFIDGVKGDAAFEYGLSSMRQVMHYGGNFQQPTADNPQPNSKFTKYYSEDGSYEVIRDNQTGQEKHILYIGGNPYESDIVYLKNYTENSGSYKFLHKDYLGSVLAITDESGNIVEQRHYDAWGQFTHLKVGNGAIITDRDAILNLSKDLIIDRGYTSHEHLYEVGLIHMNGRLYDPVLRRFLNADENIQDMFNTQNYNKYGYVLNNPLMYNDPSGEFLFAAFVAALSKAVFTAVAIAATVDITVGLVKGSWSINGFFNSLTSAAVSAIASFGIGEIFQLGSVSKFFGASKFFFQAIAHGASQGVLSVFFGGNFWSGATAAAFASLSASAAGSKPYAQIVAGAISGGIGAVLAGGNFWQGAGTGLIVAGLNHAMHEIDSPFANDGDGSGDDEPKANWKAPRKTVNFKVEQAAALFIEEDNKSFFDVDVYTVKGSMTLMGNDLTVTAIGSVTTTQISPYFFGEVNISGSSPYGLSTFNVTIPLSRSYGDSIIQSGYQEIGTAKYTLPRGTSQVNVSVKAGYIFNVAGKGIGTPFPRTTNYNYHFGNQIGINQYPIYK